MLSAPASIPPTTVASFTPAVLADPGTVNHSSASRLSPARSANAITGTNPAEPTRFGSSNDTDNAAGVWESCISEMPFLQWQTETLSSPIFPVQEGISTLTTPALSSSPRWIEDYGDPCR